MLDMGNLVVPWVSVFEHCEREGNDAPIVDSQ